ncbi:Cys-tRNA(Pro) deacylase [uncultured Desulfobacter sp.]|uniref:Cys-tRNA(Pro) deacylase n=1 Tax=uncultured Desulfobacter sp. TaxID=240139 RepID=UPI002AABC2F1|nr:Cys-tRNA(Pro) deacylase [uncultured Desulfobacter sp.]
MTPAINTARKAKVEFKIHEYSHDPRADSYGQEAAEKLGVDPDRVFKTLVVSMDSKDLGVAILPVSCQLNLKLFARAMGVKKAAMADKKLVEKTTGYVLGGVSPIGQKKRLSTVVHDTAKNFNTIFVSAGKRGLDIELTPDDLVKLTKGKFDCICE